MHIDLLFSGNEVSGKVEVVAGPIDEVKDPEKDIRATPLDLPAGFEWSVCDIMDDVVVRQDGFSSCFRSDPSRSLVVPQSKEIYDLLYGNYVEDDDAMFRFDYSIPFLKWCVFNNRRG